jgi:hypothetical protein
MCANTPAISCLVHSNNLASSNRRPSFVQPLKLLEQVAAVAEGHDEAHADLSTFTAKGGEKRKESLRFEVLYGCWERGPVEEEVVVFTYAVVMQLQKHFALRRGSNKEELGRRRGGEGTSTSCSARFASSIPAHAIFLSATITPSFLRRARKTA